jgi:poly(U)-specific endoribonuclease
MQLILIPNRLLTFEIGAFDPPTISKLIRLHDNYYPAVGIQEDVTQAERREETEFLDAIMATPIMGRTEAFLTKKGLIPPGRFREIFRQIWFGLYSRSGNSLGSSGFEHVFLGELKKGVSGFHSWAFFGREERNNALNYKGHISKLSLGSVSLTSTMNLPLRWSVSDTYSYVHYKHTDTLQRYCELILKSYPPGILYL